MAPPVAVTEHEGSNGEPPKEKRSRGRRLLGLFGKGNKNKNVANRAPPVPPKIVAGEPGNGTIDPGNEAVEPGNGTVDRGGNTDELGSDTVERRNGAVGIPVQPPLDEAEEVWNNAYEQLRTGPETKELVEIHEKIMSMQLELKKARAAGVIVESSRRKLEDIENKFGDLSPSDRQKRMVELAQDGLTRAEKTSGTKETVLTGVHFVLSCRDFIAAALEPSPYASLAWTGMCTVLPVLENAMNQPLEHTILLKYVLDQAEWYSILATSLKKPPKATALGNMRTKLKEKITEIYKLLIKTNMHSICRYYHRNKLVIFLRDAVKWEDWEEMLKEIKTAEVEYRSRHTDYYEAAVISAIEKLDLHLQQQKQQESYNDTISQWSKYQTHRTETDPPGLIAETGNWFFEHPNFVDWSQWTTGKGLLLLKASPGCGKSVLASAAVKRMEDDGCHTVCHFFFKGGSGDNTAEVALRAILHQLFSRREELLDRPVNENDNIVNYMQKNKQAPPERMVEILWDILEATAKNAAPEDIGVVCVLDALNECESGALAFCGRLQRYLKNPRPRIKFFITTRWATISSDEFNPEVSLERTALCSMIDIESIESDVEKNEIARKQDEAIRKERRKDINSVIQYRINAITESSTNRKKLEKALLLDGPQRTFLWVSLIFKFLELEKKKPNITPGGWLDQLTSLPTTVNATYDSLLAQAEQIWMANREQLVTIFKIVIAAKKALTLEELYAASTIHGSNPRNVNSLRDMEFGPETMKKFRETIQEKCGFFLVLDHRNTVNFFHQTAQEFLEASGSSCDNGKSQDHGRWKGSVSIMDAHALLAKICARSILFRLVVIPEEGTPVLGDVPTTAIEKWENDAFFPYSGQWLDFHIYQSIGGDYMQFKGFRYDLRENGMGLFSLQDSRLLESRLHALSVNLQSQHSPLLDSHLVLSGAVQDPGLMSIGPAELSITGGFTGKFGERLATLAEGYFTRFELLRDSEDLQNTVNLTYQAKECGFIAQDEWQTARRFDMAAQYLLEKFKATKKNEYLEQALEEAQRAVGFTERNDPENAVRHVKVGLLFCKMFGTSREQPFLNDAVTWGVRGANAASPDDSSPELKELFNKLERKISQAAKGELEDSD